ncbi:hypothetical protein PICMEDRAFT_18467, partial [Pichia membranifaciens NRRL Y-2026]
MQYRSKGLNRNAIFLLSIALALESLADCNQRTTINPSISWVFSKEVLKVSIIFDISILRKI